ncbi:hypothetical protein J4727_09430 [Providencia rettgeri]|uniref:Uncharacterized protein n=1 Tax=Providencia rettgeri TaxID=587 RepID=A0A939NFG3_PRORE|nr:hypothetical protein [Providencia rettgeri]
MKKSGSLAGDIKTSVGGGIAIRTIGIDDVVAPDEKFGVSLKLETSSNSTRERIPTMVMAKITEITLKFIKIRTLSFQTRC